MEHKELDTSTNKYLTKQKEDSHICYDENHQTDDSVLQKIVKDSNNSSNEDDNIDEETSKEQIDIDEFLLRSGECSTYQYFIVVKIMLLTFPLSYPVFVFYFISYDPHWVDLRNSTNHMRENSLRCKMNRSYWDYDYDKSTMTTEVKCFESYPNDLSNGIIINENKS